VTRQLCRRLLGTRRAPARLFSAQRSFGIPLVVRAVKSRGTRETILCLPRDLLREREHTRIPACSRKSKFSDDPVPPPRSKLSSDSSSIFSLDDFVIVPERAGHENGTDSPNIPASVIINYLQEIPSLLPAILNYVTSRQLIPPTRKHWPDECPRVHIVVSLRVKRIFVNRAALINRPR